MARFVLRVDAVRESIDRLLDRRIHSHFVGYLCLLREAERAGRMTNLRPNFKAFFDLFLRVEGGPVGRPYYRPMWDERRSRRKAWYQQNVAGSFSPASASRIVAFTAVVDVEARSYSLKANHPLLARNHLAYNQPIPVVPLATYLFRDFAFEVPTVATGDDLVTLFRTEFGLSDDKEFLTLFQVTSEAVDPAYLFERL